MLEVHGAPSRDTPLTGQPDKWVADLLKEDHDIENPSFEDVERVAIELWGDGNKAKPERVSAIEIVLGHRVDARDISGDAEVLGHIITLDSPQRAISALQMLKIIEHNNSQKNPVN